MGDYQSWQGGEILKKMEYAGIVEAYASQDLATLHGLHDVLRQTLAGRADPNNVSEEGDRVYMKPDYYRHYEGFISELERDFEKYNGEHRDKKYQEAKDIIKQIKVYLSTCTTEVKEDPTTFFKRSFKSCPRKTNELESDLIKLNRATSNVHRIWEQKLSTSFKKTKLGKSPTPEQCMIVQSDKLKETPKWATNFCKGEHFMDNKDMSALILACEKSGAILMRRLDVEAGENEGLHSTQILVKPKEIKILPNVDGHEEDYRKTLEPLNPTYKTEHSVRATIPVKNKGDMEKKIDYLSKEMSRLIRPNTGMPLATLSLK